MIKNITWLFFLQLLFVFVNGEGFGVPVVGKRTKGIHHAAEHLTTADKITYVGKIRIGTPKKPGEIQEFTVAFDTGSTELIVVNANHELKCKKSECPGIKNMFDPSKSSTYQRTDGTFATAYADGSGFSGHIAYDQLEFGDGPSKIRVTATIGISDERINPIGSVDGVFGLAFGNTSKFNPQILSAIECIFAQADIPPQFGYYVNIAQDEKQEDYEGEFYFGGYNPNLVASAFSDPVPLNAPTGMVTGWTIAIKRIEIGGNVIDIEGQDLDGNGILGTEAVPDTGTSITFMSPNIVSKIMSYVMPGVDYQHLLDMRGFLCEDLPDNLPDITYVINDRVSFTLGPENYVKSQFNSYICRLHLESEPHDEIIFGNDFFERYYTVFDYEKKEMKFALAKQPEISAAMRQPGLYGKRRLRRIPRSVVDGWKRDWEENRRMPIPVFDGY